MANKHILIAETVQGLQRSIALMLRQANYMITTSQNGDEAFAMITSLLGTAKAIDLLVADLDTDLNGTGKLIDRLSQSGIFLPTIILTENQEIEPCTESTPRRCFITKPFEPEVLMNSVDSIFNCNC